jgi:hypothetical protein
MSSEDILVSKFKKDPQEVPVMLSSQLRHNG